MGRHPAVTLQRTLAYFAVAAAVIFGTIARNSNGSFERFSPACRCTGTQSNLPMSSRPELNCSHRAASSGAEAAAYVLQEALYRARQRWRRSRIPA